MQTEEIKDLLTCGDVAKLCRVSSKMVAKWIDSGILVGYRLPGSRDRRVAKDELLKFTKHNKIPLHISAKKVVIFLCITDAINATVMSKILEEKFDITVIIVTDSFQAGMLVGDKKPSIIFVDCEDIDSQLPMLKSMSKVSAEVVVLTSDSISNYVRDFDQLGIDAISKPYKVTTLIEEISKRI